jgi:GNAT superfamily N-acetyltransferase
MIEIREPVPEEAEALARCQLACWRDAYTGLVDPDLLADLLSRVDERAARWREILADPSRHRVATDDEILVGFASAGPPFDEDATTALQLYALYVRRSHWDTGLGHRLLTASVGDAPATLWVLQNNERARRFYAAHGFAPDGTEQDEPHFHAPEIRMVRGR